ncbi:binding-protein-dependent transport system inner membrane protein [Klebsiella michiganensis]|uniref:Binding-protein-dependent transport system inner membrane protein n=1 Tax=Klebsiella michiganensis TaxID=1134687 RepID=A0A7H4N6J5_9ENTR|nr:binding-protein-dependent transport system inner membrane protein [Klebsiella michiganensis]
MNANLAVIVDNLDYLLWGRLADGIPGGVVLTLLMAVGAAALALPGACCWRPSAWRYDGIVRRLLFLWAEIIRGIPLIFVIFWLWYLLPMLTGSDLPGAVTVTVALAWFTAASVMHSVAGGPAIAAPRAVRSGADPGFCPRTDAAPYSAAAGSAQRSALAGRDIYRAAQRHVAGVYRQRAGTDHRRRGRSIIGCRFTRWRYLSLPARFIICCAAA